MMGQLGQACAPIQGGRQGHWATSDQAQPDFAKWTSSSVPWKHPLVSQLSFVKPEPAMSLPSWPPWKVLPCMASQALGQQHHFLKGAE